MRNSYVLFFFILFLSGSAVFAQGNNRIFFGGAAANTKNLNYSTSVNTANGSENITVQSMNVIVGMPLLGQRMVPNPLNPSTTENNEQVDLGFPWNVSYFYDTFADHAITISKGYYSDKVQLDWQLLNNVEDVTNIEIYRTADVENNNPDWGAPIVTLAGDMRTYEDRNISGGILFRYKIKATGFINEDPDITYKTFITGIGFRNPAAVIAGSVNFDGGNPVEDVTIAAVPDGGFGDFGSALDIPANGYAEIESLHESLNTSITLQAWVKPQSTYAGGNIRVFSLQSDQSNTLDLTVGMTGSNQLNISVGGYTLSMTEKIPNGLKDNKENDLFMDIADLNTSFVHIGAALANDSVPKIYINGRKIDTAYIAEMNAIIAESETATSSSASVTLQTNNQTLRLDSTGGGTAQSWTGVRVGGNNAAFIDDLRVWNKILDDGDMLRDYKRYLKGDEKELHVYIRANEVYGNYAYDLSSEDLNFNKNDLALQADGVDEADYAQFTSSLNDRPTYAQLGIFGITDENGSYIIPSIPYQGTGETFVITPSKGVHEFNPNQELVYLGEGSTVVNNVDFIDVSSFNFNGRVLFDSRDVFPPGPSSDEVTGNIIDGEAYNAYLVDGIKYPKGEYWAEYSDAVTPTITKLVRYAPIPLVEANVYIDGNLVLNEDNEAVVTDDLGRFSIQVPIGEHNISVKKFNHEFKFNGRFPAEGSKNFFEDNDEEVVFLDETKVTVVGRVVGGTREGDKPLGFGFDGVKTHTASPSDITYTSVNNIGTASVTFGYRSPGATNITPEFQTTFSTNNETGEYRIDILPLRYEVSREDVYLPSQPLVSEQTFLSEGELLNFTQINGDNEEHFMQDGDTIATSLPFNFKKNFIKRVTPEIDVALQTSDTEITIGEESYTVSNSSFNVYTQSANYKIDLRRIERYTNYDVEENGLVDEVPVTDGDLIVTNQLKGEGDTAETLIQDEEDPSILHYVFRAGDPNTDVTSGFLKTISLLYRIDGIDYQIAGYQNNGIILGGVGDGGQTFQTAGPEVPDIILRDPPGSNSFATIEEGSTFSIAKKNSGSYTNKTEAEIEAKFGVDFGIGGGILGPLIETENYVSIIGGFGLELSTTNGDELTRSYSFGSAISTSDDPDWVGADADLYIGSSSNMFYGLMNNLSITDQTITDTNGNVISIPVSTTEGVKYISLKKVLAFGPGEETTTFIYSQRELINDIIPHYETIVENYACIASNRDESTPPVACPLDIQGDGFKSLVWYQNQIQLWRRAIQLNEETKYRASTDRGSLKADIIAEINDNFQIAGVDTKAGRRLKTMLDNFYYENISFDSGVGSIEKSIETGDAQAWEHTFAVDISATIGVGIGLDVGGSGFEAKVTNENAFGYGYEQNETVENNLVFSYTLQDNDDYNKLSVDVINTMDGNGPVFITRGGETSCPVEEAQFSYFFNEDIQPVVDPIVSQLTTLSPTDAVELSAGTIGVEVPYIAVENASIAGVPEGDAAEFTLTLRNDSVLGPEESEFILYVNLNTNPDNAIFNLGDNGRVFFLDGAETVEYTLTLEKGSSDVYDYEDIEIIFESLCDDDLSESITVSAYFIESCTTVNMLEPENNWVKNNLNTVEDDRNIPLNIVLNEFDLEFDGFERLTLEYRQAGSSDWLRLQTYVVSQTIYDQLVENGDSNVSTLTADQLEITYAWDIIEQGLTDGEYEIRGHSYCSNGTEYTSRPVTGRVDLSPPTLFGTPQPTNGILSIGSDLIARFNEPVKANGTLTRYEFQVQKNQLPVNHEVSLAFNGSSNTARIDSPFIKSGNFSIEFWLNHNTQGNGTLLAQEEGLNVALSNGQLSFTIGGETITANIATDQTWNHYALSYNNDSGQLILVENDNEIASREVNTDLSFNNNNPIVLGGNGFVGNLHDLRFWSKFISRETAVAYQNELLNGNERDLIGYWPMNEGHGNLANDISRFKHLQIENASWEIFPNGTAYLFDGTQHLTLTEAAGVIITKDMDATLSFWMKTAQNGRATLLSNGRGDESDLVTNNTYRNKWSIELNENGGIELKAENRTFGFGSIAVNDDEWHHIALVLRRNGNLSSFIDGQRVSTAANGELGGFANSKIFLGARGQIQLDGSEIIDQHYRGYMDELRIWSLAKSTEQINEDQYFEANYEALGLMLHAPFNAPEVPTGNGPRYYYPVNSLTKASTVAALSNGQVNYTEVTPPVKPRRPVEQLIVNASINGDEVFLVPQISDWASVEKKVANVTIANLYDASDNRQLSPVTWSVFINKNPLSWYIEGYGSVINLTKSLEEDSALDISVVNRSGTPQPYYLSGPSWLDISEPEGTVPPNSTIVVRASVSDEVSPGKYDEEIVLRGDYGFDEKIQLNLRVIAQELNWDFNPEDFDQSMNVIGKIRVNNTLSTDLYDRVVAYIGDEVRGVGELVYDNDYDEYFMLLTIYGNTDEADEIEFRIWDASDGRLKVANIVGQNNVFFTPNGLLGSYQEPAVFDNTIQETQRINLNQGWTWVSFNVNGNEFDDLNTLFANLNLQTSDIIVSNAPAQFDTYEEDANNPDANGWYGTISANGGLDAQRMYKIRLSSAQTFYTTGARVNPENWTIQLNEGWNWLPFIINARVPINEALARFDAQPGDLIKSQTQFAIYDGANGWKGTLDFLTSGQGYMLRAAQAQAFSYPSYFSSRQNIVTSGGKDLDQDPLIPALSQFEFSMNIIAQIPEGYDKVRFFDSAETFVGEGTARNVDGKQLVFATVYGDTPGQLSIALGCEDDWKTTQTKVDFIPDTLVGSLDEPLTVEELTVIEKSFVAYPNPVRTDVQVQFTSTVNTQATLILYTTGMNRVLEQNLDVMEGENQIGIPMHDLPQGSYVLHLNVGNRTFSKVLIKQ